MIKIAIIGGGAIAKNHAQAIASINNAQLAALAELRPEIRKDYSQKYGIETFEDYEKMLRKVNPDAVVVCLPHHLHLQAAKTAMQAGAHVLLEKPMEISVERCDEIIKCSQKYRKKLFVGHLQRYLPVVKNMKTEILAATAGRPLLGLAVHYSQYFTQDRPHWFKEKKQAGGGNLMNHGVHYIDRLTWLFDSKVKQVFAHMRHDPNYREQETIVNLNVVFGNGLSASILLSGAGGNRQFFEIACSNGSLSYSANNSQLLIQKNISDKEMYGKIVESKKMIKDIWSKAIDEQMTNFVDCIENDTEPPVSGEYGRYIIKVAMAAYQSAKTGKVIDV